MLKAVASWPRFFTQAAGVSLLSFLNLALSLSIQVYLAQVYGLAWQLDAYFLALAVPSFIIMTLYGAFHLAFVPVFRDVLKQESSLASTFQSSVWWSLAALSTGLSALVWLVAPWLAQLLTLGSPELFELTRQLLQLGAPVILFQGISQVLLAFHTANNRFLLPQATHLLATGLVLLLLWQFLPTYGVPLLMIAWVSGYFIQDVILWLTLPTKLQLTWRLHLPALKLFWSNLWPLALGAVIYKGNLLYDRFIAAWLPEGEVSTISYAFRLITALVLLLASGVSLVTLPMSSDALGHGKQKAGELLNWSLRALLLLTIPAVFGLVILAPHLVSFLFERGAFTALATQQVSSTLIAYTGALIALVIGGQITNVFYAQHDSKTVVWVNLLTTAVYWLGLFTIGLRYGAVGIALSYSLVTLLTALWLLLILHRRKFPLDLPKLGLSIGRMILASAVMSGVMISLMTMISLTVFSLMGLILVAVGVYAGTMYLLRAPELRFWRPTV